MDAITTKKETTLIINCKMKMEHFVAMICSLISENLSAHTAFITKTKTQKTSKRLSYRTPNMDKYSHSRKRVLDYLSASLHV